MTTAEISLSALTKNYQNIKSHANGKEVMAVVKANAYGHGIHIVVPHLYSLGVRAFAVSDITEAHAVCQLAPVDDILILGITKDDRIDEAAENGYIQTIADLAHARLVCEQVDRCGVRQARCHIKVNTGMNRLGVDTAEELAAIMALPQLKVEGILTHFASADCDADFTEYQLAKFVELYTPYCETSWGAERHSAVSDKGLKIHAQNSAGTLLHSEFGGGLNMVRAGLGLYGYFTEQTQVMTLKSEVVQVREVTAGTQIGYGGTYVTTEPRRLAIVCAGYADGYSRLLSNRGCTVIGGKLAPIRGRVCMEYITVDVTDIDVKSGDVVTLYGTSHDEIKICHIAELIGTIPYEVTCNVSDRIERKAVL